MLHKYSGLTTKSQTAVVLPLKSFYQVAFNKLNAKDAYVVGNAGKARVSNRVLVSFASLGAL
jgi:hypothetical protein